jgi:hypothetical protein
MSTGALARVLRCAPASEPKDWRAWKQREVIVLEWSSRGYDDDEAAVSAPSPRRGCGLKRSVRRGPAPSGLGSAKCALVGARLATARGNGSGRGRRAAARGAPFDVGRRSSGEPTAPRLAVVAQHRRCGNCGGRFERVPSQTPGSPVVIVLAGVDPTELPASCRETAEVVPRRASGVGGAAPGHREHERRCELRSWARLKVLERVVAAHRRGGARRRHAEVLARGSWRWRASCSTAEVISLAELVAPLQSARERKSRAAQLRRCS